MTTSHILFAGLTALMLLVFIIYQYYHHQCLLRNRAHLMREAIRNKDFSFRLPTKGLSMGERALQEALNDCSGYIHTLAAQKEMESLQRLTRVLTHEIMNAAAPISSITQAYLSDPALKNTPYEEGIRAIHTTSTGMTEFVKNFRQMSTLPEPMMTHIHLLKFLETLKSMHTDLTWHLQVNPEAQISADENMLRQVLNNIIKNAQEAGATDIAFSWQQKPLSTIYPHESERKFSLSISNNGRPIPVEVRSEIFIPFFTTKNTGTGIGLPLSRQMMMKQGIHLLLCDRPLPGYHTTFLLCN